jgi:putative NADH-flavin reductase
MTITIFGATGMVGKQLVKQALLMGHNVRAFGRNVITTFREEENLELLQGALFDEDQVYRALNGSDAVLSALGGASDGTDQTRSLGMKNIIKQMKKANVKRVIALGGMGVLDSGDDEDDILMNAPSYPKQYIPVGKEHYKAFTLLQEAGIDYTFVGAPDIIDADATGLFATAANTVPSPNNNKINAGDIALFMLNELKDNRFIQQRVGISN